MSNQNPPATEPEASNFRWALLGGISLLWFCAASMSYSTAALVTPLSKELQLSYSELGAVMGAWSLTYLFFAIPAGVIVDRYGLRFPVAWAAFCLVISALLRASATDFWTLFIAHMAQGVGSPFLASAAPKLVRQMFPQKQRGIAIGITSTTTTLGAAATLSLTNYWLLPLMDGNWRSVLHILATLCFIALTCWLLLMLHPERKLLKGHNGSTHPSKIKEQLLGFLSSPSYRVICAVSIAVLFFLQIIVNWLPNILSNSGANIGVEEAGYLASLPLFVSIFFAMIIPAMSGKDRQTLILGLLFILGGISALLLSAASTYSAIILALIFIGIVRSSLRSVFNLLIMNSPGVGIHNISFAVATTAIFGQLGGVAGPFVFGVLADIRGGFDYSLYFMSGGCLVVSILLFATRSYFRTSSPTPSISKSKTEESTA